MDDAAWKITLRQENKITFDAPRDPEACNTVKTPSLDEINNIQDALKKTTPDPKAVAKAIDVLEDCHGRDLLFTGNLYGPLFLFCLCIFALRI